MKYTCHCCNFTTELKGNYDRHNLTSKHLKNLKTHNETFRSDSNKVENEYVLESLKLMNEQIEALKIEMIEQNQALRIEKDEQIEALKVELRQKNATIENLAKRITVIEKRPVLGKTLVRGANHGTVIGNINQNVNIVLKCFGTESIDHIGEHRRKELLNSPNMALRLLLKEIHFNPEKEEYQNIKFTNMKNPIIKTLRTDGWSIDDRDETLEELCQKLLMYFEEIRDEFGDVNVFKSQSIRERFDELMTVLTERGSNTPDEIVKRKKEIKSLGRYLHQLTIEQSNKNTD